MTPFEEQLKRAMARREPGEDFTRRVLDEIRRKPVREAEDRWGWWRAAATWRLAAVVAALLVMSGSAIYERERAERGEAAKEKLMTAVRIAGVKFQQVRRHVLEVEATEVKQ
jgi:anti-sigma-K factor RskA